MKHELRNRRATFVSVMVVCLVIPFIYSLSNQATTPEPIDSTNVTSEPLAITQLDLLEIKGRAPKTDYAREQFGDGWSSIAGCDTRNIILHRDLIDDVIDEDCNVLSGVLDDPYTGKVINFTRGSDTSSDVQIDHVVALSDAWQKGAQKLSKDERITLANDPLELLAVDGPSNQQKSDGDAATWLPPNKAFRCQYIARQIAIKVKYRLWVTQSEHEVMRSILSACPDQKTPTR